MKEEKIISSPFHDTVVPENLNLYEFLSPKFTKFENKTALICSKTEKRLTFSQIIENVQKIAICLKLRGVKQNEVVCICIPSAIEYLPILFAITSIEAICTTSNPAFTVEELEYHFKIKDVQYVICDNDSRQKTLYVCNKYPGIKKILSPVWHEETMQLIETDVFHPTYAYVRQTQNSNIQFLFSSSGTTGQPKAVMRSAQNIITFLSSFSPNISIDGTMKMFSYDKSDIVLSVFPHFQAGGLILSLISALKQGATCVILPRYRTKEFIQCIEKYKPTVLVAAPPVYVFLTKSPQTSNLKIPSLRHAFVSGAPVGKELVETVCRKFYLDYMIDAYGMTEISLSHMTPISGRSKYKRGSCGVVVPNGLCKVVDINGGHSLGPNENGEICFKSAQVMVGYFNNDGATKETIDADGWFHTGDVGYYDENNYFYIVDRIKELIKVKGYQVAPAELEDLLLTCPGVEDVAVVGVKDEYAGELPRAYIVKNPKIPLTAEDLKTFVARKVVSYKHLNGGVKFVEEIPKGPSGKILRRLLRDQSIAELNVKSNL